MHIVYIIIYVIGGALLPTHPHRNTHVQLALFMDGLLFADDDDFHVYQLQVCEPRCIYPFVCLSVCPPIYRIDISLLFFSQWLCDSATVHINFRITWLALTPRNVPRFRFPTVRILGSWQMTDIATCPANNCHNLDRTAFLRLKQSYILKDALLTG